MHPSRLMTSHHRSCRHIGRHGTAHAALARRRSVGVAAARPWSRRALRAIRTCRGTPCRRRDRRPRVRPARERSKRRGPGRYRSMEPVPRRPRRTAGVASAERRRPSRRPVCPLPGRARCRRLPHRRPAAARLHRAVRARSRLDPGQMEARTGTRVGARGAVALPSSGIRAETLSRDPEVGRRVRADPLNITSNTLRFAGEALGERAAGPCGRAIDRLGRRSYSTASTTASSRRQPARSSKAHRASNAGPTRASATSSTTSRRASKSSTT